MTAELKHEVNAHGGFGGLVDRLGYRRMSDAVRTDMNPNIRA